MDFGLCAEEVGCKNFLNSLLWMTSYMIITLKKNEISALAREYFDLKIRPRINQDVVEILQKYHEDGYLIVVVSGGLKEYIQFISEVLPIDEVIAKELSYVSSKAAGSYINAPCYYHDKVLKIEHFESKLGCKIERRVSISDNADDLPMLLYGDEQYVVRPDGEKVFRRFIPKALVDLGVDC